MPEVYADRYANVHHNKISHSLVLSPKHVVAFCRYEKESTELTWQIKDSGNLNPDTATLAELQRKSNVMVAVSSSCCYNGIEVWILKNE